MCVYDMLVIVYIHFIYNKILCSLQTNHQMDMHTSKHKQGYNGTNCNCTKRNKVQCTTQYGCKTFMYNVYNLKNS